MMGVQASWKIGKGTNRLSSLRSLQKQCSLGYSPSVNEIYMHFLLLGIIVVTHQRNNNTDEKKVLLFFCIGIIVTLALNLGGWSQGQ